MRLHALIIVCGLQAPAMAQCEPSFVQKLTASDGTASDFFGLSVGIDRDVIVSGAVWDAPRGDQSGSAYVFEKIDGTWTETLKLIPDNGGSFDHFGRSVSVSGDTIVVGAQNEDTAGSDSGAAYVFERDGNTWVQTIMLKASDAGGTDRLGWRVDIDGDTIITSAHREDERGSDAGAAYIFVRDGDTWTEQAKLLASDGVAGDEFGHDVAISGDRVIVGAYKHDEGGSSAGAVYVFERAGEVWTQTAKLTASDRNTGYHFGRFIELDGQTALIGSPFWHPQNYGAAYVFRLENQVWTEEARLHSVVQTSQEWYASSVAIEGDIALAGSFWINDDNPGSAQVNARVDGTWDSAYEILTKDGRNADSFGRSPDLSNGIAVISADGDNDRGVDSGSIYVYDLGCGGCPADLDANGSLDADDFFLYLDLFAAGQSAADIDGDGDIDAEDFFAYLDLFAAGC